ncbi:MAG: hypothetical protein J6A21_02480, partial [Lentisphaeria bacterium]|nr:hypothetical protein [Lentisphaeria bacterium]
PPEPPESSTTPPSSSSSSSSTPPPSSSSSSSSGEADDYVVWTALCSDAVPGVWERSRYLYLNWPEKAVRQFMEVNGISVLNTWTCLGQPGEQCNRAVMLIKLEQELSWENGTPPDVPWECENKCEVLHFAAMGTSIKIKHKSGQPCFTWYGNSRPEDKDVKLDDEWAEVSIYDDGYHNIFASMSFYRAMPPDSAESENMGNDEGSRNWQWRSLGTLNWNLIPPEEGGYACCSQFILDCTMLPGTSYWHGMDTDPHPEYGTWFWVAGSYYSWISHDVPGHIYGDS